MLEKFNNIDQPNRELKEPKGRKEKILQMLKIAKLNSKTNGGWLSGKDLAMKAGYKYDKLFIISLRVLQAQGKIMDSGYKNEDDYKLI